MYFLLRSVLFTLPTLAFVLDMLFGDPERLPHPVRLMGRALDRLEELVRGWNMDLRGAGAVCVFVMASLSFGLVRALGELSSFGLFANIFSMFATVYFAYAGLALGQLLKDGRDAAWFIENQQDLTDAREAVGYLVTRDTSGMDAPQLRQTLAETLSENLCDAFVAPLFYLILGGAPGLWAYKAVSTMDSMWGYRTERFERLGWAAARLDDVLAYVPARLTALLLCCTGACLGLPWRTALRNTPAQARTMESPNAGWSMAAAAWLLGGSMGGPVNYFGSIKMKPLLGPEQRLWDQEKLERLLKLLLYTGIAALVLLQLLAGALELLWKI